MRRPVGLVVSVALAVAGVVVTAPGPAAAAPPSPIGSFDGVSARFDDVKVVSGWAADTDAPGQPTVVRLYLGSKFVTQVSTGDVRPDVAAALPGVGPSTGWHATITPADLWYAQSGTVLCAYAINVGAGANATLGCRQLAISGPSPYNPVGNLERVTTQPGLVLLRGWAGDPDGGPMTRLRVYYDGYPIGGAVTATPRPDVDAAFGLGPTTGFNLRFPVAPLDPPGPMPAPPGQVHVCVYAENSGARGNQHTTLGCAQRPLRPVTPRGPNDPHGNLDRPEGSDVERGWAYDPDSAGPATVVLRRFHYPAIGVQADSRYIATLTTGLPRPDVQASFPAAGPNAGFEGSLHPLGAAGAGASAAPDVSSSVHFVSFYWSVCAYVVNVGPGSDRFVGCRADGTFYKVG